MTSATNVLLVDDDPVALLTTEAQLAPEGWTIHRADRPHTALEKLAGPPMDLVICDAMMPDIDGFDVCRRFKASPSWSRTPLILLTALSDDVHVVRGLEAGADGFVSKPVAGPVLRARARAALRTRSSYEVAAPDAARVEAVIDAAKLTSRERQVLELLLLGRTHEDIATALAISERTSRYHQTNLFEKLGAESRLDLLRIFSA